MALLFPFVPQLASVVLWPPFKVLSKALGPLYSNEQLSWWLITKTFRFKLRMLRSEQLAYSLYLLTRKSNSSKLRTRNWNSFEVLTWGSSKQTDGFRNLVPRVCDTSIQPNRQWMLRTNPKPYPIILYTVWLRLPGAVYVQQYCAKLMKAKVRHWRNFARMKIRIGEISRVGIFFVNGNDDGWVVIRPFVLIVTRYCKSSQQGNRAVSGLSISILRYLLQ